MKVRAAGMCIRVLWGLFAIAFSNGRAKVHVPLNRVIKKIMDDHAAAAFGEFKGTILGMLDTCVGELHFAYGPPHSTYVFPMWAPSWACWTRALATCTSRMGTPCVRAYGFGFLVWGHPIASVNIPYAQVRLRATDPDDRQVRHVNGHLPAGARVGIRE